MLYTDGWRGCDGLVDLGFDKHFRIQHGENQFGEGSRHVNRIESFWSFAKRRLLKFSGVPNTPFSLHLKETEFRFNHRTDNLFKTLLSFFRNHPL